jgi:hypothetical protein
VRTYAPPTFIVRCISSAAGLGSGLFPPRVKKLRSPSALRPPPSAFSQSRNLPISRPTTRHCVSFPSKQRHFPLKSLMAQLAYTELSFLCVYSHARVDLADCCSFYSTLRRSHSGRPIYNEFVPTPRVIISAEYFVTSTKLKPQLYLIMSYTF